MERIVHTDEKGRRYDAWKSGEDMIVIIGPPEGVVDVLGLPEPFSTRLHNCLHARGIFSQREASRQNVLLGALQDALSLDVQRLNEAYFRYEEEVGGRNE
jgi:hypothetical protein